MARVMLYSYLNLESTKTKGYVVDLKTMLYSYLNLESTKTVSSGKRLNVELYSYLNLESTKTKRLVGFVRLGCTVT